MVVDVGGIAAEPAEDAFFGIGVDAGQSIVEDEDGGSADECAGDGAALLLSAGEGGATLADHGFEPLREFFELGADMCGLGSFEHFFGGGIRARRSAQFSRMVSENRKVSCGTMPMLRRSTASGYSRSGRPSIRSEPAGAS